METELGYCFINVSPIVNHSVVSLTVSPATRSEEFDIGEAQGK